MTCFEFIDQYRENFLNIYSQFKEGEPYLVEQSIKTCFNLSKLAFQLGFLSEDNLSAIQLELMYINTCLRGGFFLELDPYLPPIASNNFFITHFA